MRLRAVSLHAAAITAAHWFWLFAAGAAVLGAAYLLLALSDLRDSTRFASDLAEIRTFAMRVALVSETVSEGNSPEYLEHELELAHLRSEALAEGVVDLLGTEFGDQRMQAMVASWDAVAEASRQHARGALGTTELMAAAERATGDVDTLLDLVARRNEAIADGLRSRLAAGIGVGMVGAAASAAALTWALRQLRQSQRRELRNAARFEALVQHASDAVVVLDPQLDRVTYVSPSVPRLFGPESIHFDVSMGRAVHPDDLPRLRVALARSEEREEGMLHFRVRGHDASWRDVEALVSDLRGNPLVSGVVLNMRDVTERTRLEAELQHRALHDTLTGLPNRALLCDRLAQALRRAADAEPRVAVLFVDLDDFKAVNDSLGHAAGDALLRTIAGRLTEEVAPSSTVGRLAGDEFAIVLEACSPNEALEAGHRVATAVAAPVVLDGRALHVTASVGVAVPTDRSASPEVLLRDADVAMYAAKRRAPGSVSLFDPELHAAAIDRSALEIELRGAADRGEFRLAYQPIVELATGRVSGHEALVRWQHATRGLLTPDQFIPLAEATGSIIELDAWVLNEACSATARRNDGIGEAYVTVNVSPVHLDHGGLIEHVERALVVSGLPPRLLTVEITEGMLIQDPASACSTIDALRALGVRIAIDDFGTGYSSLSQLREFPPDLLKIDRSFISAGASAEEDAPFVRMILDLARSLKVDVVAEGVETSAQADYLRGLGCRYGQGYYFGRPAAEPISDRYLQAA